MKVGYYAPLPPARTGVADYAATLLAALRRHGDVEVNARRADVSLYHLGNNQLHAAIYRRALEIPGVAVLHDAVLQHFFLGSLDRDAYVEEYVFNYGEWTRGLAERLWRERAASATSERYFAYPMLRRIAERSRALVVHNDAAAALVRSHAPAADVTVIPHLFAPPALTSQAECIRFRQALAIPANHTLFGVFGYLRESKRLLPILRAFAAVRAQRRDAWLLVAGDFVSSDLARAAAPLLETSGIARVPFLAERDFWLAASAVDACLNLRWPGAGETSGIAVRLMGIGKPVVLSAGPEAAGFPPDACLRVEHGPAEECSLQHHLLLLTSSSAVGREIGRRGAAHIARYHAVERVAEQYWNILCAHSR